MSELIRKGASELPGWCGKNLNGEMEYARRRGRDKLAGLCLRHASNRVPKMLRADERKPKWKTDFIARKKRERMRQRFSLRKPTTSPGRFAKGLLRLFFSGLGRRILARWRLLALLHLLLLLGMLFLQLLGLLLVLLL